MKRTLMTVAVVLMLAGLGALDLLSRDVAANLTALAMLCVLALTLYVLVGYARDTKTIAETSVAQARAQHQPLLVFETAARPFDVGAALQQGSEGRVLSGQIPGELRLLNIGPGPAFEVWVETEEGPGFKFFVPHLNSAQAPFGIGLAATRFSQKPEGTETEVRIRYRGIGGRFESRYSLQAGRFTPAGPVKIQQSYLVVAKFEVNAWQP